MKIIKFADLTPTRWANGQGATTEIQRSPASESFAWRLSVAEISGWQEFSPLPGLDRTLVALGPGDLSVHVNDFETCLAPFKTMTFRGEDRVSSSNFDAPTLNVNVMTRRGHCTAFTVVSDIGLLGHLKHTVTGVRCVVFLNGSATCGGYNLQPLDTIISKRHPLTISGSGEAILIRLVPDQETPDKSVVQQR